MGENSIRFPAPQTKAIQATLFNRAGDWRFFTERFNYTGPANGLILFNFNRQNQCSNIISVAAGDSFFLERVPEPASLTLLGIGLLGAGFAARRRKSV